MFAQQGSAGNAEWPEITLQAGRVHDVRHCSYISISGSLVLSGLFSWFHDSEKLTIFYESVEPVSIFVSSLYLSTAYFHSTVYYTI